ncbi:MAG: ferrous iron transport protein B [Candidatus Asgardarchaeia archaeon]
MSLATIKEDRKVQKIGIALAGNPNVGKSVIFNELTGGRAWVGNWPGTTVEKKVGKTKIGDYEVEVLDLPGIYSLTAYSLDELVARNGIVEEKPDVVIDIVNATNFERSLYLTISLLEMGAKIVVALNMVDLAESQGYGIDVEKLSKLLGVPVIPTIAIKGYGLDKLKEAVMDSLRIERNLEDVVDYGNLVEDEIRNIEKLIKKDRDLSSKYLPRWLAIKLLEKDDDVEEKVKNSPLAEEIMKKTKESREIIEKQLQKDTEEYIAEKRYEKALEIVRECLRTFKERPLTLTDMVDFVTTHKFFGIPIMLTMLYLAFKFAFDLAAPLCDLIDWFFGTFLYDSIMDSTLPPIIKSFLGDGIIAGIGSVLVFLPNIAFLFLFLSFLEDVGYMARAAFVVDKVMHKLGLTGKSIIPMILGFGCNVPAIMATRAIEDENDRKVTALVNPLMSCSARLPVYLIFASAFFASYKGTIVLSMYVLGLLLAIAMALFFRKILFRGPSVGFVMELPPYMVPVAKNMLIKTWERSKKFLFKAGTIILLAVILIWILSITGPSGYIGIETLEDPYLLEKSWIGVLGHFFEKIFSPMGWDWRASAALFFGFVAKEVVVAAMAMLYGADGEEALPSILAGVFTPLTAYAYMAFVLIYVPCLATLASIRSEFGMKYASFTLIYEILLAYFVALGIVYVGYTVGIG